MPTMPRHACSGCRRLVVGPCPTCTATRRKRLDRERAHDAHRRLYGTERWRRYSRSWLAQFPWCGQRQDGKRYANHSACTRRGLMTLATQLDHIVPASRDVELFFSPSNHQSLCGTCNASKGAR